MSVGNRAKAAAMAAWLVVLLPSGAAAQLCLGRTLPGDGSVTVDAAFIGRPVVRFGGGDETEGGIGWRVGVVAADPYYEDWAVQALQAEVTVSRPATGSVVSCPGVSVIQAVPSATDRLTVVDLFASFALPLPTRGRTLLVPFLTPHLTLGFVEPVQVNTPDVGGGEIGGRAVDVVPVVGATAGFGALFGGFTLRGTATLLRAADGMLAPIVGLGAGLQPGWTPDPETEAPAGG